MKHSSQFKENRKLIHTYLKEIKNSLPLYSKKEKIYLQKLSIPMYDYVEFNGDDPITMEELIAIFGDPKECVSDYIESMNTHEITYNIKKSSFNIVMIVLLCVFLIVYIMVLLHHRIMPQGSDK